MMNLLQLIRRYLSILAFVLVASAALTACKSVTSNDTVDYKSAGAARGPNLSYPPDLITAQADRRYIVQDGTATMSEYNAAVKKSVQMRSNVMTGIPGMRIARDGERRWLSCHQCLQSLEYVQQSVQLLRESARNVLQLKPSEIRRSCQQSQSRRYPQTRANLIKHAS
jgi:uncharacterized lipoprotein